MKKGTANIIFLGIYLSPNRFQIQLMNSIKSIHQLIPPTLYSYSCSEVNASRDGLDFIAARL